MARKKATKRAPKRRKRAAKVPAKKRIVKKKVAHAKTASKRSAKKKTKAKPKAAPKSAKAKTTRAAKAQAPRRRATARSMAAAQREISVSEFFTKNRHLLGFDSPTKALLTTIKEAVDNSLDACEEAGILPTLGVSIEATRENRYRIAVTDNGPGILKNQIPRIFGKLLYGSKFHRLRQSRGQQGIGISAAGMYGQLTTGKPVVIESRTSKRRPAHRYELVIDTKKNEPVVKKDSTVPWEAAHGTRVEIELEGVYRGGKHGVESYLAQTALANPHVEIRFWAPKSDEVETEPVVFKRSSKELPVEPREIKPHPHGVELGLLMRMLKDTQATTLKQFFQTEFSRIGPTIAKRLAEAAGLRSRTSPRRVSSDRAEGLLAAVAGAKIPPPPMNCLSPIGEERILASLRQQVEADYYDAVTRSPSVYRGNPFQIEVGLAYGGALGAEDLASVFRYANRVPLLYQAGACALTKSVLSTNWKSYGLLQARGAPPTGPLLVMVHIASVWVPFTSESKEAVASYDEILKEVKLGLQQVGRKLGVHLKRAARARDADRKRQYIEKYIPHIGIALRDILDLSDREEKKVVSTLTDTLRKSRKM